MTSGQFDRCNDVEIVRELHTFIDNLDGISSYLVSDHILNRFADLKGQIPEDRDCVLSILQRFLDLEEEAQLMYRFGRRLGAFASLNDLGDKPLRERVSQIMSENNVNSQNIDSLTEQMMQRFI